MNAIFDLCVVLLIWAARVTGTTYKQINVLIFCIVWPLFTVALMALCWRQRRIIRDYRREIESALAAAPHNR
jgi:hypothetical protein